MNQLRVLMVTPYFPPIINGPSLHVYHLVRGLVDQGIDVHLHSMGYEVREKIIDHNTFGFTISHFKPVSLFRGASFDQPISLSYVKSSFIKSDDFDIVHIHDFPKLCNDSLILALKKFKPSKSVVLTPHGAGPLSSAHKMSSKAYWATGIPFKVVKSVDSLISVTSEQTKAFAQVCDKQKISLISEAIPDHYFVKSPFFTDDGKLKILFIGRIIQEKGVRDLLYAVNILSKLSKYPIELRCIGPDYGFMAEAFQIIKTLSLEGTVRLLGPLPENQKLESLNWCDVLVLPSYYEAFGIPIIEAMAHGKPVIATKTIGAMSLVSDNETGFLINFKDPKDMANKFLKLINNSHLKLQMGKKALISASPFTMNVMIANHIDLYRNLAHS
jgi:glycosyltransferase involved in cell wall biosynthesis